MIKIIASPINDLTTARYFAAMNVDYLAYDYDFEKTKSIKEMIDWVQGPKTTIVVSKPLPQEEFDIMAHTINPDFLLFNSDIKIDSHIPAINKIDLYGCDDCYNHFIIKVPNNINELSSEELDQLKNLSNRDNVFLEFQELNIDNVKFAIENNIGLSIIANGNEEKTGVKSFDELDEIFDFINKN